MKCIAKSYILFILLAMLAGCNSEDSEDKDSGKIAVLFTSGAIESTRTTDGGNKWVQGDSIGVFMIKHSQPLAAGNISEDADNRKYMASSSGATTTQFQSETGKIYYPVNGDRVDFIAYYPYSGILVNGYRLPVNLADQSSSNTQFDVLYSNNVTDKHKGSNAVNMEFGHVFSKLNFTLVPGVGLVAADLAGAQLEINNLYRTTEVDLADGSPTNAGSPGTITANTAPDGTTGTAIVIPQSVPNYKISVVLADGVSRFEYISSTTTIFQQGKIHSYNITVNRTGINVTVNNIKDWNGTQNPPETGVTGGYKVGDYYPDPNDRNTAKGVVFYVDPKDPAHGKMVSVHQRDTIYYTFSREVLNQVPGMDDYDNGMANMDDLMKYAIGKGWTLSWYNFHALKWLNDYCGGGMTNKWSDHEAKFIWYIPAVNELSLLYGAYVKYGVNDFEDRLRAVPGGKGMQEGILRYLEYWSSTRIPPGQHNEYMFFIRLFVGEQISESYGSSRRNLRPIAKF